MKVKCLGLEPGLFVPKKNALTMRPLKTTMTATCSVETAFAAH